MKGKMDAYVLCPLATKFQNWIVDRSTARDFTVFVKVSNTFLQFALVTLRVQQMKSMENVFARMDIMETDVNMVSKQF